MIVVLSRPTVHYPPLGHRCDLCHVGCRHLARAWSLPLIKGLVVERPKRTEKARVRSEYIAVKPPDESSRRLETAAHRLTRAHLYRR